MGVLGGMPATGAKADDLALMHAEDAVQIPLEKQGQMSIGAPGAVLGQHVARRHLIQ